MFRTARFVDKHRAGREGHSAARTIADRCVQKFSEERAARRTIVITPPGPGSRQEPSEQSTGMASDEEMTYGSKAGLLARHCAEGDSEA